MKRYLRYLVVVLLFLSCGLCAQNKKVDSLIAVLTTDKADTNKLMHLNGIVKEFAISGQYDTAEVYGNQAILLALSLLQTEKNASAQLAIKRNLANSYNYIGNVFNAKGNYPEALKKYLASLKMKEQIGDKKGIAASYNNIGLIYFSQQNYDEALKNYFASLQIRKQTEDQQGIAACYNNIGLVYYGQNNYEKALKYHQEALAIRQSIGDKSGIAYSQNNIGNVYYDLKQYPQALENVFASLKLKEELDDKAGMASSYASLGKTYTQMKNYSEARKYLGLSRDLSGKIGHIEILKYAYGALVVLDSTTGNYKGAYENYDAYLTYRDSLNNERSRKEIVQNQLTYEFEKKEAVATAGYKKELESQSAIAEEKGRKQKLILSFVIASLILVLVFFGFVFRSLRTTRKQKNTIEEQKNIVELKKQEVIQQKSLVEQKQKEVIDSIMYARRIQRSLLPTEKYIDKSLKRLNK